MRADLLIILLFLIVTSIAWAATAPEATDEQTKASENICPEGFLEGYPCRKHRRVKRIVESHEDAIAFIGDILARRAPEGLQDLPMPTEFAGLFSYLRWHRALYGLDDIDPENLPRLGPDVIEEDGQGTDTDTVGTGGTTSQTPHGEGVEGNEEGRTVGKHKQGADDSGTQPPVSGDEGRSLEKKQKRRPIPGLPPYASPAPSSERNMLPEEVAPDSESDEILPSESSPEIFLLPERSPGGEESRQGANIDPAGTGGVTSRRSPPNAEKDTEGGEKHRVAQKQDKGSKPKPVEIDGIDTRHGKLQGHRVLSGSPEYRNVLGVLDPDNESAQQEMEIYRIDSCAIGEDRGESGLPAENVTDCGPSGRLLAGFKPGKYRIIKDNFPPSYQPLLAGLEHSLLGYELPEGETVLILGYADHIPYKDDYDPPRIDKYKRCALRAGELQFGEFEVTGDGRSANDDGNRQLALARAREIQRWLKDKEVLKSDRVCLEASPIRPEIDSVSDGEPLDRAVAVYILRTESRTTETNHERP
uniref:OmpA family protein n=1 Tax=Candidatus Kentrum sp. LPFa TaxID=2126335 RepID=A0A450VQ31_9GAMM|nr:MAG: hypothetical protein BECKLPF1236A_GA0070988_100058 [Candidatus Kentron sp. LPFa]VFK23034.1 MAG: hypothetical protein BECKLPF1236C_GA0070990_100036 [Candidatus Kentron sp. LPFa]